MCRNREKKGHKIPIFNSAYQLVKHFKRFECLPSASKTRRESTAKLLLAASHFNKRETWLESIKFSIGISFTPRRAIRLVFDYTDQHRLSNNGNHTHLTSFIFFFSMEKHDFVIEAQHGIIVGCFFFFYFFFEFDRKGSL